MPPRPPPAKRRSVYRPPKKSCETVDRTYALYRQPVEVGASAVTDDERTFFFEWGAKRNLEKQHVVLAITYWMRVKSKIWTCFFEHPKQFYMIACIHVALKWLGYDEMLKCNFIKDLREIGPITMDMHQSIEFMILSELGWDL